MENKDNIPKSAADKNENDFLNTPMKKDAFKLSDDEKIKRIEHNFSEIMSTLGLDLKDDSLQGTPRRVAEMYVKEMFWGLNPDLKPKVSNFKNKFQYREMLVERDIIFYTNCEHHFVPFFGKANIAYFPNGKVIGLSKLNRIVEYFSKRPQVQERMTMQIANELKQILNTENVAVILNAKHLCVASRGIKDDSSHTNTSEYCGMFKERDVRVELHRMLAL
jgi:GTP cyclohydrolase I